MKIKGLILTVVVGVALLSSCSGGYTCPTYAQDSEENTPVMVKEISSDSEVIL